MKQYSLLLIILMFALNITVAANTNYVGAFGTPSGNYFTDIQSAVDATLEGGLVLVSNGVYKSGETVSPGGVSSNRILVLTNITIRSISGPQSTIIVGSPGIDGACGTGAVRCIMMSLGNLFGFTLSNGFALNYGSEMPDEIGGGVYIKQNSIVSNCVVISCKALAGGGGGVAIQYSGTLIDSIIVNNEGRMGGVFLSYGGLVENSTIINNKGWLGGGFRMHSGEIVGCVVTGNYASSQGGGIDGYDCVVRDCRIENNTADLNSGIGGGLNCFRNMYISDCTIISNSARNGGGICCYAYGAEHSTMSNCVITANLAGHDGGGVYFGKLHSLLLNCLITDNYATNYGGGVFFFIGGITRNCTIVSNEAERGGGVYCDTEGSNLNSIIYFNSATYGSNYFNTGTNMVYEYCCSFPMIANGVGNISGNPLFSTNYFLSGSSPCRNTGANDYAAVPEDLAGKSRIIEGVVDMGCYEYEPGYLETPIHYVSLDGGNVYPYTNWSTAAREIQSAVSAATVGDEVLVSNGVYESGGAITPGYFSSNRVVITTNITVRSVWGPESTVIVGAADPITGSVGTNAVRGVYMCYGVLSGFTISNGYTMDSGNVVDKFGGGINASEESLITNCIIRNNLANDAGGINSGIIRDCIVVDNKAYRGGGTFETIIYNSVISNNIGLSYAGGVRDSEVIDSIISCNSAHYYGGGVYEGVVSNSIISDNYVDGDGGAGYYCETYSCIIKNNVAGDTGGALYNGTASNCLVYGNIATNSGGGTYNAILVNCTLTENASITGDGGGTVNGTVYNSIVYYNAASSPARANRFGGDYYFSCLTPSAGLNGNISAAPLFVSAISNDYHLQATSPCRNAGTNAFAALPYDLDGNPRIVGGRVDMGCYEFVPEGGMIFSVLCLVFSIFVYRKGFNFSF